MDEAKRIALERGELEEKRKLAESNAKNRREAIRETETKLRGLMASLEDHEHMEAFWAEAVKEHDATYRVNKE